MFWIANPLHSLPSLTTLPGHERTKEVSRKSRIAARTNENAVAGIARLLLLPKAKTTRGPSRHQVRPTRS